MKIIGRSLRVVRVFANVTIVLASTLPQAPNREHSPVFSYVDNNGWWLILASTVAIWVTTLWLKRIQDPRVNAILRTLLTELRDHMFPNAKGQHADHRVTLMVYRRFYLKGILRGKNPWSGWLVPFVRPGHTAQKTGTFFCAPDDPRKAEGVAGKAWVDNSGRASELNLPDLKVRKPNVLDYARRTNVPVARVRKTLPQIRSFMAFVLNKPTGEHWGVLVVDSKTPDVDDTAIVNRYNAQEKVLQQIVEVL